MATITQVWSNGKKTNRWKVQIRRKGIPIFCLNFNTKKEAIEWAEQNEFEYIRDPQKYLRIDRLSIRREREEKNLRSS